MDEEEDDSLLKSDSAIVLLQRIAREITTVRKLTSKIVFAIHDAEAEVPEKMRRFATYYHDIHDIKYMYEEHGVAVPEWVLTEIRRLDDRYRQLLKDLYTDTGAFERIRREMAADPENRYDHTRQLFVRKDIA